MTTMEQALSRTESVLLTFLWYPGASAALRNSLI